MDKVRCFSTDSENLGSILNGVAHCFFLGLQNCKTERFDCTKKRWLYHTAIARKTKPKITGNY
jgi:hypothetical protein